MLGNTSITPAQFERCKAILIKTGALKYARTEEQTHIKSALSALHAEEHRWPSADVAFLRQLAEYLLSRTT